jgi:plastocyanin
MAKPGAVAFPVLLVLGAITGYLSYNWMIVEAVPKAGDFSSSPYYKPLSAVSADQKNTTKSATGPVDESKFSNVVKISILSGASVQGAKAYDPATSTVPKDALIKWVNDDNVPHSATSGKGFSEADYGKLFDSGFLDPGKSYSVPAATVGTGEHPYFCQVHPFMAGTLKVQ